MRCPSPLWILLVTIFVLNACNPWGTNRYRPPDADSNKPKPFVIAVVGNGVPGLTPPRNRVLPKDRANGLAMWKAAEAAFKESDRTDVMRRFVEVEPHDDGASPQDAERIAKELVASPRVLAVIGHATSDSTRMGAWRYAQAGIPLLMPIATSPNAAIPPGMVVDSSNRLHNCFRLAPSDDRVQAPAVAFVASQKLLAKRCYLLGDFSPDVKEYSAPLYEELGAMLDSLNILATKRKYEPTSTTSQDCATSIRAQKSDLLVFCGYGTRAQELLDSLRDAYKDIDIEKRPKVLLTDGCKIKDLDTAGFKVYLTFPLPDLLNIPPDNNPATAGVSDLAILLRTITKDQQSYQMYAYDAMLMIGQAIEKCASKELSRSCIQQQLNSLQNFSGAYLGYSFVEGENSLSSYYLYSAIPTDAIPNPSLVLDSVIQSGEIIKLLAIIRGR